MYFLVAHLARVNSLDGNRVRVCLRFLEKYMMSYAFHPVLVGKKPSNTVMATLTYITTFEGEFIPSEAPSAGMAEVQNFLNHQLWTLTSGHPGAYYHGTAKLYGSTSGTTFHSMFAHANFAPIFLINLSPS